MGSNFPNDPKPIQEETDFNPKDRSKSENARHGDVAAALCAGMRRGCFPQDRQKEQKAM